MPPKRKNTSKINDEEAKRRREEDINAKKLRLIQLVKEYPVLYNLAHPDHKNSEVKKVIWDQIVGVSRGYTDHHQGRGQP